MESLGVYEDLSLFNGDLVGVVTPPDKYPVSAQDGLKHGLIEYNSASTAIPVAAHDFQLQDAASEDADWMEKKMDLIKLLSDPNVEVTIAVTPSSSAEAIDLNEFTKNIPVYSESPNVVHSPIQFANDFDQMSRQDSLENIADLLSFDFNTNAHAVVSQPSQTNCPATFGDVDVGPFGNDSFLSFLTDEELCALEAPILSPVSPEDVESILSSMPSSPQSTLSAEPLTDVAMNDADSTAGKEEVLDAYLHAGNLSTQQESDAGPLRSVRSSRLKKYSPYRDCYDEEDLTQGPTEDSPQAGRRHRNTDRKERKKQQNKDAALRYRLKKKQEQGSIFTECDELEKTNTELKDKVDGMEREIQYLKDLLLDVYKAKGIQPSQMLLNSK